MKYIKMIFVIYCIWLPRNHFSYLRISFTFKQMILLQGPLQLKYLLTFSFCITKKTGLTNVLQNVNQPFIEGLLIVFLYFLNHLNLFREYMSSKHQNINFSVEHNNIDSRSFLDVKICRKNDKFITSVYRKPTCTRVKPTFHQLSMFHSNAPKKSYPEDYPQFSYEFY